MSEDKKNQTKELLAYVRLLLRDYKPFDFYEKLNKAISGLGVFYFPTYDEVMAAVNQVVQPYVDQKLAALKKKLECSFDLDAILPSVREVFDIIRIQYKYCLPNQRKAVAQEREELKSVLLSLLEIKSKYREELEHCLLYSLKTFDFSILTNTEHNQRLINDRKAQKEEKRRKDEQDQKRSAAMQKDMHEAMRMFVDRDALKQNIQKFIAGVKENKQDALERLIAANLKLQYFTPQEFEKIVSAASDTPFQESILPMGNESSNSSIVKKVRPGKIAAAIEDHGEKSFDPDSPVNSPDNPSLT